jgi:hypothetical protein
MSEQYDILLAAGLDPAEFEQVAYATPLGDDKPAVLVGKLNEHNTAIRAWPVVVDGQGRPSRWDAIAFVSAHPALALDQLSVQERARLRAEALTPSGAEAPVGQEQVVDQPAPALAPPAKVDYAPPVQPLEGQAEELPDDEEVVVEEADCGYPGCMQFTGPQGDQVQHVEGCPEFGDA